MVRDIFAGSAPSRPEELAGLGDTLFFQARDGAGFELWRSDGTAAGTVLVKDIDPDPGHGGSEPSELTAIGGMLFFAAGTDRTGGGALGHRRDRGRHAASQRDQSWG
jgi:ELWxxDGT repeat protein